MIIQPTNGGRFVSARRLPDGYQEVEWIEKHPGAVLNTGMTITSDSRVMIDCYLISKASSRFGCQTTNYNGFIISLSGNTAYAIGTAASVDKWTLLEQLTRGRYCIDIDGVNHTAKIDGVTVHSDVRVSNTNANFILGYVSTTPHASYQQAEGSRFYSFRIYREGILVCDLVPCRILENNDVGMYDIIRQTYHGNAYTEGYWSAGPDV